MAPQSHCCCPPFAFPTSRCWHHILRCNVSLYSPSNVPSSCACLAIHLEVSQAFWRQRQIAPTGHLCERHAFSSIQSADVDCAIYLMAASGLFVTMKAFLGDLQIVSPSAKACLSLVLVTGATTLLFWLLFTSKMSLGSLIVSFFALCLFIYGVLEIAFALLDRWAVRSDMLSDVIRYVSCRQKESDPRLHLHFR